MEYTAEQTLELLEKLGFKATALKSYESSERVPFPETVTQIFDSPVYGDPAESVEDAVQNLAKALSNISCMKECVYFRGAIVIMLRDEGIYEAALRFGYTLQQ